MKQKLGESLDACEVHAGVENVGERVAKIAEDCVRFLVDGLRVEAVYKHLVRHRNAVLFEEVERKAISGSGQMLLRLHFL